MDHVPAEIVLGLSFRRPYDVPLPYGFKPRNGTQGMGASYVGFGVPLVLVLVYPMGFLNALRALILLHLPICRFSLLL